MSALALRALKKSFGDVVAVDGIDLEVRAGECFGLLGPNGAGKTTTIEICEGLTAPDSGDVELLGRRWSGDERELRERLGIQLQDTQLSEKITVRETLDLFRSFYRQARTVDEVIAMVQLEEKRDARVGTLSGGQKQRLALACALVGDPELLFLDEPTTGLDPQARRQLWELIDRFRADGRTTLITTHYMDEAERLCDRVAIMDHGKVIALGTPARADRGDHRRTPGGVLARERRGGRGVAARAARRERGARVGRRLAAGGRGTAPRGAGAARRARAAAFGAHRTAHALGDARGRVREAHREASPR